MIAARKAAGYRSAREAALSHAWAESTYRAHETGSRTIGQDDAERYARRFRALGVDVTAQDILFGDDEERDAPANEPYVIPIMGYVGAGGDVDPEYEQVPFDGLEQIEVDGPFGMVGDPIGFRVRGESMVPKYEDGDVVIVEREQPWATDSLIGDVAVVRTHGGHRYIKKLMPGSRPHTFDLVSVGGGGYVTMEDVRIAWASPVRVILPNVGLRRRRSSPTRPKTPTTAKGRRL